MAEYEANNVASILDSKAEHSKFGASISNMVAGNNYGWDLFSISDKPTFIHLDKIDSVSVSSAQAGKPKNIFADFLLEIWDIDKSTATQVLDQNTQLNLQGDNNNLSRQFLTNDWILRYKHINSQFFNDTFFITASEVSTLGNICDQIFVRNKGFVAIYPMRSKRDFPDALHIFCK